MYLLQVQHVSAGNRHRGSNECNFCRAEADDRLKLAVTASFVIPSYSFAVTQSFDAP